MSAPAARLSIAGRRRLITAGIGAVAVLLVLFLLLVGTIAVPPGEALLAAVGIDTGTAADFIVGQLRAPRAYTTVLIGVMFGLSGAILQSLTRNPLASPDVIGVSAGAGAGAVLTMVLVDTSSMWTMAAGAVIGGLAATTTAALVSLKGRAIVPLRLVLVGIGLAYVSTAVTQYVLSTVRVADAQTALVWLVGSTQNRTWTHVAVAAAVLAVMLPVLWWASRDLAVMEMGDDTATALGVPVDRARVVLIVVAVLLAAGATAVTGPVGFVALVAPAIARRLTRSPGVALAASALMGAVIALAADALSQSVTFAHLPIGIFTAIIGAPYLLWLIWRAARKEA